MFNWLFLAENKEIKNDENNMIINSITFYTKKYK